MYPVVGLSLAQSKLQTMHFLEWICFHVHQREQQAVGIRFKRTFGSSAYLALSFLTLCGQMCVGGTTLCVCSGTQATAGLSSSPFPTSSPSRFTTSACAFANSCLNSAFALTLPRSVVMLAIGTVLLGSLSTQHTYLTKRTAPP